MRAWSTGRVGSIDDLVLGERARPEVGEDEVLVRVKASAVNPFDLAVPELPGSDFAGVVEEVGSAVRGVRVGEEIFGFLNPAAARGRGAFAEYLTAGPGEFARKPERLSFAEAACAATAGMAALQALRGIAHVNYGQRILIIGASGGVGSLAVQIARDAGAEVWATCRAPNAEYVRRLGAAQVLDSDIRLREIRSRFHMVLDLPSASSFTECERILKTGGVYIATHTSLRFLRGLVSSIMSSKSCRRLVLMHDADDFAELSRLLDSRRVKVPIDASYSMDDVPAALRHLRDQSVRGKVAVVVSAS